MHDGKGVDHTLLQGRKYRDCATDVVAVGILAELCGHINPSTGVNGYALSPLLGTSQGGNRSNISLAAGLIYGNDKIRASAGVGGVYVSTRIQRNAIRLRQTSLIAPVWSGDCRNGRYVSVTSGTIESYAVVTVPSVYIPIRIQSERRIVQTGLCTRDNRNRLGVALTSSRINGDAALVTASTPAIRDIDLSARIDRYPTGIVELCFASLDRGDRRHITVAVGRVDRNLAVPVPVHKVRHVDLPAGIHCDTKRMVEFCPGAGDRRDSYSVAVIGASINADCSYSSEATVIACDVYVAARV